MKSEFEVIKMIEHLEDHVISMEKLSFIYDDVKILSEGIKANIRALKWVIGDADE